MGRPNVLPGGGPWKVLQDCPASIHCSERASRRENGGCTCPRSRALRLRKYAWRNQHRAALREKPQPATPRWLQAGPWRILEECPADGHNITTRARGAEGRPRCICPRARALKEEYDKYRRVFDKGVRDTRPPEVELPTAGPRNIKHHSAPNWYHAVCRKPENYAIVDAGFDAGKNADAALGRIKAKDLCRSCPLRKACASWALQEEDPAGSWGGVWGGMDPWDRVKLSKQK